MGKRGPKGRHQVSTKWSPNLAYAVGLITTDGCLSKDGRHITFTSKDLQLIEAFKESLNVTHVKTGLTTSGNGSGKKYLRVQLSDVRFYKWLKEIGLTPRKSLTLGELNIPRIFFFDFLRGCFDGDGTIYSFWDKRWRSSYMFYLAFNSGSLKHLHWLQKEIDSAIGIFGRIKLGKRCYQLNFAKQATRILWSSMFYKDKLPYLERKFIKAQSIFAIDKQHMIDSYARVEKLADSHP